MWSSVPEFVQWFVSTVINPMLDMLKSVNVLGYSLFAWLIGISVVTLGIRLTLDLFEHDNKK